MTNKQIIDDMLAALYNTIEYLTTENKNISSKLVDIQNNIDVLQLDVINMRTEILQELESRNDETDTKKQLTLVRNNIMQSIIINTESIKKDIGDVKTSQSLFEDAIKKNIESLALEQKMFMSNHRKSKSDNTLDLRKYCESLEQRITVLEAALINTR